MNCNDISDRYHERNERKKEMAVQVYTFKITYLGVENRIWRKAQVSSNYDLARLGFMALSTFDTLACHLFGMTFKGVQYYLDIEEFENAPEGIVCSMLCMTRLSKLKMEIGDKLLMTYDYGCNQQFELELVSAEPMLRGKGTSYPKIIAGECRGIVDDIPAFELMELIKKTDETGSSGFVYEKNRFREWDYRDYDMDCDNALLKGEIDVMMSNYFGEDDEF